MSEYDLRQRLVRELRCLDAVSVENHVFPGTPDVNYVEGWLELKWLRRWPARENTVVMIEHFTLEQRVWLRRRWERGGDARLLLQVGREYLLFDGDTASRAVGRVPRGELRRLASRRWPDGMSWIELREELERGR